VASYEEMKQNLANSVSKSAKFPKICKKFNIFNFSELISNIMSMQLSCYHSANVFISLSLSHAMLIYLTQFNKRKSVTATNLMHPHKNAGICINVVRQFSLQRHLKVKGSKKILFNVIDNVTWRSDCGLVMSNWQDENVLVDQTTLSKCQVTLATQQQ